MRGVEKETEGPCTNMAMVSCCFVFDVGCLAKRLETGRKRRVCLVLVGMTNLSDVVTTVIRPIVKKRRGVVADTIHCH